MPHDLDNAAARHARERARSLFVLACVGVLYAVSLLMPALRVSGGPTVTGAELLVRGWQGITRGIVAWYANPAFAAAFVLAVLRRDRAAASFSGLALLLAAATAAVEPILALQMSKVPTLMLLPGFYVWLGAIVALLAWSCFRAYSVRRPFRQMADRTITNRD